MGKQTHYSQQSKKIDSLYFNLIKITNEAQKMEWESYSMCATSTKDGSGANTEVWVAYASNEPVIDPNNVNKSGIEMYMSVTTSEHAVFTTHMGIQRVECDKPHKNIAVTLHAFCAKIMHECYPDKICMITAPMEVMRDILSSNLKSNGKSDAVYIYDNFYREDDRELAELMIEHQSKIKSTQESGGKLNPKAIPLLHLYQDILTQREKITKGELFPSITYKMKRAHIFDKHTGAELSSMKSDDPEFSWFFKNLDIQGRLCPNKCVNSKIGIKFDPQILSKSEPWPLPNFG